MADRRAVNRQRRPQAAVRAALPSRCSRSRRSRRAAPRCTMSRSRWRPGEVVAIVGAAAQGRRRCWRPWSASGGRPRRGAHRTSSWPVGRRLRPQDDVVHRDLPLPGPSGTQHSSGSRRHDAGRSGPERSTRRSPRSTSPSSGPSSSGRFQVGSASGRAYAVEMLARPRSSSWTSRRPVSTRLLPRGAEAPPPPGGSRRDDRAHHAQPHGHRSVRPDRVPRPRWLPGLRGDTRRGAATLATGDLTVAYERLVLEDSPETWAQRFASVRRRSHGRDAWHVSSTSTRVPEPSVVNQPGRSGRRDRGPTGERDRSASGPCSPDAAPTSWSGTG